MTEPVIRSIPLDRLELSPANVRKTTAGEAAFAELKASIAAHGLIENLLARSTEPAEDGGERFAVIAGARRLAAMNQLATEGVLDADHPVPCRIVANGAIDGELSLAENVVRVAMHPADQVEAFGALALAGATIADIAARFGVSERTVEQRLRLGHVAPELLDAYREDRIDLATLKAFTVTTDCTRQLAVWEQVSEQGYRPTDWQIKRMLTDDRIPAGAALARYVGVDAYEAAGGPVLRDLFADEYENGVWLEDPALLMKLALERLQVAADELATRWKWAEARIDVDWSDLARFGRVHPTPAEPTDEETAERGRLRARQEELADLDDDEWTEELVNESDSIQTRLAEIEDAVKAGAIYQPDDIAIAGCIVTVGDDGQLQLVQGLVSPEDMPAKDTGNGTAGTTGQDQHSHGQHAGSGIATPGISGPAMPPARPDPEAEARKEAGVGIGLADDLRAIRTTLVKAHLAEDFGAAFDLMLFQMCRAVFTPGYHDHALDIAVRETPDRPPLRANDDTFHESSPGEEMLADRSLLRFDWFEIEDRAESFAALRALAPKDKKRLFAACVARTLNGQLAFEANARPETEATVARLDIEFADHVRPGAEMFWSRVRKDRMLDVARRTLGIEWAHTHRKDKKATLATAMETAFAAGDAVPLGVSKEARAAALAWVPPGFAAFDTGHVDEADTAAPQAEAPPADRLSQDVAASDDPQSGARQDAPAGQPEPAADAEAPAPHATDTGDSEQPAPSEPSNGAPVPETTGSPGVSGPRVPDAATVAPTGVEPIDAMNAVPVAGGGPRVIVNTVGIDADDGTEASPETDPSAAPVPGNGHDTGHDAVPDNGSDTLDIPAFLRR
ncbi:MAG: ParB/RepB/Spo0J family partition protein [Rhodospirillales bacterium]|nr:ParB/RepB/Spo0J family partition protein [Rhodospirillales bacterium]